MDCNIRLVTIASKIVVPKALLSLVNVQCVKGGTAAFVFQQRIVSSVTPQSAVTAVRLRPAVIAIAIYVKTAMECISVPFAPE